MVKKEGISSVNPKDDGKIAHVLLVDEGQPPIGYIKKNGEVGFRISTCWTPSKIIKIILEVDDYDLRLFTIHREDFKVLWWIGAFSSPDPSNLEGKDVVITKILRRRMILWELPQTSN